MRLPKIERIQVAEVRPDDVIILHLPSGTNAETAHHLLDCWDDASGLPNKVIAVTGDGLRIEIERPTP
jgi:hypothetical protein